MPIDMMLRASSFAKLRGVAGGSRGMGGAGGWNEFSETSSGIACARAAAAAAARVDSDRDRLELSFACRGGSKGIDDERVWGSWAKGRSAITPSCSRTSVGDSDTDRRIGAEVVRERRPDDPEASDKEWYCVGLGSAVDGLAPPFCNFDVDATGMGIGIERPIFSLGRGGTGGISTGRR